MKKIHLSVAALLLTAATLSAPRAQAQTAQKIGYTSVEYVLSQMPESKQIESELKTYGGQLQAQLKTKQDEFQRKLEEYQRTQGTMTEVVRKDKEKELQNLQTSIQEFSQNAQQSMQQKQGTLLRPVLDKVQKAIDAVADESGYAYVLNSDSGANPVLLHGPKDGDISDLIFKKLGVTPAAPGGAPKVQTATPPRAVPPAPTPAPTGTKVKTKTK